MAVTMHVNIGYRKRHRHPGPSQGKQAREKQTTQATQASPTDMIKVASRTAPRLRTEIGETIADREQEEPTGETVSLT